MYTCTVLVAWRGAVIPCGIYSISNWCAVCDETKAQFSAEWFESLSACVNALDNVDARVYMDGYMTCMHGHVQYCTNQFSIIIINQYNQRAYVYCCCRQLQCSIFTVFVYNLHINI